MKGLETQVFTITLSITATFMVLFYKRRKMPFKFKVILQTGPFCQIGLQDCFFGGRGLGVNFDPGANFYVLNGQ